jgi:hypothetical protein
MILRSFEVDFAGPVLRKNFIILFSRKRGLSQGQQVKDDSHTKHIAYRRIFGF